MSTFMEEGHLHQHSDSGIPQSCVLSPLLFTSYPNDCVHHQDNCTVIKVADDVAKTTMKPVIELRLTTSTTGAQITH